MKYLGAIIGGGLGLLVIWGDNQNSVIHYEGYIAGILAIAITDLIIYLKRKNREP